MEGGPFMSWLLGDLVDQPEQINWLDTPDSFENLLYNNAENTSAYVESHSSSPEQLLDGVQHENDSRSKSSEEDSDEEIVNPHNKRTRRDIKNQSEAKRRNKFNEQLAALRALLFDQDAKSRKLQRKLTRESLMSSAIEEISNLRQELSRVHQLNSLPPSERSSPFSRLGMGKFSASHQYSQISLFDPRNRTTYSTEDLERAFEIMFAREVEQFRNATSGRVEQKMFYSIKQLQDVATQIGKPVYLLQSGLLEQMYHSKLKYQPKDLRRVLENNWSLYQAVKKVDRDNFIVFQGEVGAFILSDMSLLEYMTGNFEASERTYGFAKELVKRIGHVGTKHFMLANRAWNYRGVLSVPIAEKVKKIIEGTGFWGPVGQLLLGLSLIASGIHKEGLEAVEGGVHKMIQDGGMHADLCVANELIDAYVQTGNLEKGLRSVHYIIKKYSDLNIDGCMGKPEMLRLKANLVMMKKFPDYMPEPTAVSIMDPAVEDIINTCEPPTGEETHQTYVAGPLAPSLLQPPSSISTDVEHEDVEMLLRSAMQLAQTKELYTIELRCAIDLVRYFLYIGSIDQAMDAVQVVKGCLSRMKGPDEIRELARARYVISLVECQ